MRKGNKALWGVRLFEKANTAADRREKRSARRRYDRRRERIRLLQEEFNDEINKVDNNFFQNLEKNKKLLYDTSRIKRIEGYLWTWIMLFKILI